MGMNLYCAKTYKVEYAPLPMKRYGDGEMLLNILYDYGANIYIKEGEGEEHWEIEEESFLKTLDNLERENKDFYHVLKEVYDTADKSDGYVHLFWF